MNEKKVSRKDFLKTALSILLGATILPAQKLLNGVKAKLEPKEAKHYKKLGPWAG
jgi:hypothetical protein